IGLPVARILAIVLASHRLSGMIPATFDWISHGTGDPSAAFIGVGYLARSTPARGAKSRHVPVVICTYPCACPDEVPWWTLGMLRPPLSLRIIAPRMVRGFAMASPVPVAIDIAGSDVGAAAIAAGVGRAEIVTAASIVLDAISAGIHVAGERVAGRLLLGCGLGLGLLLQPRLFGRVAIPLSGEGAG